MLGLAQRAGRGMVDIAIARAAQAPVGVEIGLGRRQGNVRGHEYIRICDDSRLRPPAYPKRQALRWLKATPAGAICAEAACSSCQRLTLGFMPTTQPTPTQAPPLDLGAAIDAAVSAAHTGAAILQSYAHHRADLVIDHKARNDLVSQADREAEAAILESLRERTPEFGIVAEETGGAARGPATWYIDPLDGTTNFLHGIPHYAVSIALVAHAGTRVAASGPVAEDTPVIGVVYDPSREELFTAVHGIGAWLNGRRIACSRTQSLADAVLA